MLVPKAARDRENRYRRDGCSWVNRKPIADRVEEVFALCSAIRAIVAEPLRRGFAASRWAAANAAARPTAGRICEKMKGRDFFFRAKPL